MTANGEIPPILTFDQAFGAVFDHATATPPNAGWYSLLPERHRETDATDITGIIFLELSSIDTDAGEHIEPPHEISNDQPGRYTYSRWEFRDEAHPEDFVRDVDSDRVLNGAGEHREPASGVDKAEPWTVGERFRAMAETPSQLALVAERLVAWTADLPEEYEDYISGRAIGQTIGAIVTTGLFQAGDFIPMSSSVFREFSSLDTNGSPTHERIASSIATTLGKILLGSKAGNLSQQSVAKLSKPRTVEAVSYLDEAGVMPDSFWVDFGIRAGVAIKVPQFLPVLSDKLTGENSDRILETIADPQTLSSAFITAVLDTYSKDPKRHSANAARFLELTRLGSNPNRHVSLRKVIALSNALPNRPPGGGEVDQDADPGLPLDDVDMLYLSTAFRHLLTYTTYEQAEQTDQVKWLEQDEHLTSILELIRYGGMRNRQTSSDS